MARKINLASITPFLDTNGDPYVGAKLFTYQSGAGTTKITVTQDLDGLTNHTNPIILNASGYPADGSGNAQAIWQDEGDVIKLVLAPSTDTDPPASIIDTWDDLPGINDASTITDEWQTGSTPTFVSTTQLTLVGDVTSTYQVGRRIKTTNTGGTIYSTITVSAFTSLTTLTVVNDSGVLDSGLSAISYGLLSATNSSIPGGTYQAATTFSKAITFQSPVTHSASIYQAEGADIASATTTEIWSTDGDTVHITGTTTITSLGTSIQAGQWKKIIFDGVLILTNGANLALQGGQNITTAAGDIAYVYADTTTQHDVLFFPKDGVALAKVSSGLSSTKVFAYPTAYSDTFTTDFGADANEIVINAAPGQAFVVDKTAWRLTTNGTLPDPLAVSTDYYIRAVNSTTDIELSLTPFGSVITLTDDGSGTHTIQPLNVYTKPTSNFSRAKVINQAAGGAGGRANPTDTMGDGGAAGGRCEKLIEGSDIGATETITIGTGGVSGAPGTTGGTTSFGSILSATGGVGGEGDLTAVANSGDGAAGGVGSNGDVNITGDAGNLGTGSPATESESGGGGAGLYGGRTSGISGLTAATTPGNDGTLGGGGSGGNGGTAAQQPGGAGGGGIIIIEEYV